MARIPLGQLRGGGHNSMWWRRERTIKYPDVRRGPITVRYSDKAGQFTVTEITDHIHVLQRIAGELSAAKRKAEVSLIKEEGLVKAKTLLMKDRFELHRGSVRGAFSETADEIRESLRREKR
jgi:hypothetical protein